MLRSDGSGILCAITGFEHNYYVLAEGISTEFCFRDSSIELDCSVRLIN